MPKAITQEDWLARAVAMHGEKYDYSRVRYINANAKTKVEIICHLHGVFWQMSDRHLRGGGCPTCGMASTYAKAKSKAVFASSTFVSKAREVHGNRYTYELVEYLTALKHVTITCPEHGPFSQTPNSHLRNHGCPGCGQMATNASRVAAAKSRFYGLSREGFDYSRAQYVSAKEDVEIVCLKHGPFWQTPDNHVQGQGCPSCAHCHGGGPSAGENALADWLLAHGEKVVRNTRSIIKPLELDIWLPEHNVGIEYHGLYWHTEDRVGNLHADKAAMAEKAGIRLIQIFEDEWGEPVKQIILNAIGRQGTKVMARKCDVVQLSSPQAAEFMTANHVQGLSRSAHHLGLQHDGEIVAVMSFGRPRSARGAYGQDTWELARYATSCSVAGGASKLLVAFCREHPQATIVSYVDHRYFTGKMYPALGFKPVRRAVDYEYLFQRERLHKSRLQKRELEKLLGSRYDPALTEREMAHILGAKRILNAGRTTYIRAPH